VYSEEDLHLTIRAQQHLSFLQQATQTLSLATDPFSLIFCRVLGMFKKLQSERLEGYGLTGGMMMMNECAVEGLLYVGSEGCYDFFLYVHKANTARLTCCTSSLWLHRGTEAL
jgi:hypothetical protein